MSHWTQEQLDQHQNKKTIQKVVNKNKFGAQKTISSGIRFDSKKESQRNGELELLQKYGKIRNLRRQVKFEVIINGKLVCKWYADFVYETPVGESWIEIIEDVKGEATRKEKYYRLKKRLVEAHLGIVINEV